jgi:hypothetical protein
MQLTSTNRLDHKIYSVQKNSCQYSVASSQLEPELEPAMLFEVVRIWMTEKAILKTVAPTKSRSMNVVEIGNKQTRK